MKKLSISSEDYLECLYMIENEGGKIRSFAVAEKLGVSKPAVTKAMHSLLLEGLIEKTNYSDIVLTTKGRDYATTILDKHNLIKSFLMDMGVSEGVADIDCCKIEHVLSGETLNAIQKILQQKKSK